MTPATSDRKKGETAPPSGEHAGQYLTFLLGEEEYGIDILRVQGIQGWSAATPLPGAPSYVLGVINLRGAVVPVFDLRRRFDLASAPLGSTTVVIVVKVHDAGASRTVGLVVDAVSEVYNVPAADIGETPDLGGAIDTDFVRGLATLDEKLVILLDVDALVGTGILGDDPYDGPPEERAPGQLE